MPDDATPIARELSKKNFKRFGEGEERTREAQHDIQSPEYFNVHSSRMIERTAPTMWYGYFASTEDQINSREIAA